ncbi:MAG TPA: nucleotidyl transferase AbiEii/AbiGii toxin family protein [Polyangiaceae bacterium]|nr:nucleotidyl transferase AbiEii/AbiGii toxin family protein [Polyangiaceae bacterium]
MTRKKGTPPSNVAHSVKARLLQRARRDGEDFNSLLVRYVLERLLYRLGVSPHANEFVLKGALLFVVWSNQAHRATKDLDLLGSGPPEPARLAQIFAEISEIAAPDDGVIFVVESIVAEPIREEAVYDGIRLRFAARLGNAEIPVQVDVGFGDTTVPEPQETELPALLDFPAPSLRAYARESSIAEKCHAMVELGLANTRMKDFYDLWFLATEYSFEGTVLAEAIQATFVRRRTVVPSDEPVALSNEFATDPAKLNQWTAFLRRARLRKQAPPLVQLIAVLRTFLMPVLRAATGTGAFDLRWQRGGPWETRAS